MRAGVWKGVVHACADPSTPSMADELELYNLTADPNETNDVAADHDSVVAAIKTMLASEGLSCQCYQC